MLQIHPEQFRLLKLEQHERFLDDCERALRVDYPNAATTSPDLRERVRLLIEQLRGIGFSHAGDCKYALQLIFRYQQEAWRGPMPEVIIDKLRSANVTNEKKIEALEQLFIFGGQPEPALQDLGLRER